MQSIDLNVSLPPGAKEKLADGSLRIIGAVVQDTAKGRIVANLKTVVKEENTDYTPALFVAIQNEIFVSQQLISAQISEGFRRLEDSVSQAYRQLEGKIEFQTNIEMGQLVGEINHFFLRYETLKSGEKEKADRIMEAGGLLAARLAGMTDVLINDYFDTAEITYRWSRDTLKKSYKDYQASSCSTYSHSHQYFHVENITYPDLRQTRVQQFIPALIEIMNRLNIISVCFFQELFMGYEETLKTLRSKLMDTLKRLVFGLDVKNPEYDDYAQRVFGKDKDGNWIHENEADRLSQHFPEFSRNNLGARVFHQIIHTQGDWALVSSVREVLNMIANVDNLLMRGEDLERGAIFDSESIALLREETFPTRRNTLSLADKT
ncbi:hypothetical protein FEI17_27390 (plasmid) [Kosakonia radicincitans]|uniref:hypothetical protein n=1 Tax=Kosakonia radicincitans TaxID=283686 RepID=UPI0011EFF396|nr:hypothetical protein [Kosakonia radicincitans]QEM94350.1 hypothetical protein FEI17_27390 [Kosakonia radicincitans]